MDERIDVSLERIKGIIDEFETSEFSTADVIRGYSGGFFSNTGTPAFYSFNAQFGKLLKRNAVELMITEIASEVSIKDDCQKPTSTSIWAKRG